MRLKSPTLARSNSRGMSGHQRPNRGASDEWLTPPALLVQLGAFDLDPACPASMPWPTAKAMWTKADDALSKPWFGRVWLNPPYGSTELGVWLSKLADHGNGIALVFARTETDAFFRHGWERASAMLFLRGRLHFHRIGGDRAAFNAGAPSVLIAYGAANAEVLRNCGLAGKFVSL